MPPRPLPRTRLRFSDRWGDLLGAHVSAAGGVGSVFERAESIGASALAIFSKNSNQWRAKPLTDDECEVFHGEWDRSGLGPILVHAAYLINLAAVGPAVRERSVRAMADELQRAERLGIHAVVLHPGAHMGAGIDKGIDRIARALDRVHALTPNCRVITLLETSAGQGSSLGCSFHELGQMRRRIDDPRRVGVCLDTCHVFSAGYDLRTRDGYERTIEELDREIGVRHVGGFHINDSKRDLGARVDRHEEIGKGSLGLDAFAFVLNDERFRGVPKVLETPKPQGPASDRRALEMLRQLKIKN